MSPDPSNRDQNTSHTFFVLLILSYIYWFIIIIFYVKTVQNFVIMPSLIWKKIFLYLFYPIGGMMINMVFVVLSIIPVQSTLKLFGLM